MNEYWPHVSFTTELDDLFSQEGSITVHNSNILR